VNDELEQARQAVAAGNPDEALVLLWKAVEPARLAGDKERLAQIALLAHTIPGREAEDLVKATGVDPASFAAPVAEAAPQAPQAPRRSGFARVLWAAVIVVLVAMIGLAYTRGGSELVDRPAGGGEPVSIDADGLYLVPLARYPQAELDDVGISVIRSAGAVDIRTPLGLGPTAYDAERGQFVAEEILGRLTEAYSIAEGREVLVVGVTSLDMYSHAESAAASVSVARSSDGRYVVVSTHDFGAVRELRDARLRELLLAEIGRADL
jgi:hypothetical protein